MTSRHSLRLFFAAVLAPWLASAGEQHLDVGLEPEIRCWARGEHSTVFASVDPGAPTTRVYFRCSLYQDYYFVNLEQQGNLYTAVLPQASDDCPSVYYYVEAVSADFASSRTRERVAEVSDASECRRRDPLVALFTGDPKIIIGATSAIAPEMAPGFSFAGIAGYISAAGATSGGGGLGTAAIAGIGGAGAAGLALVASNGGSDGSEDTSGEIASGASEPDPIPTGTTPPTPPTTDSAPTPGDTAPIACFVTDPSPAVIAAGESIRFDGSCSRADSGDDSGDRIAEYRWDISDGREKTGRVVRTVFREPGIYEVTLTVVDGGTSFRPQQDSKTFTVTVEDRLEACFTATDFDPGTGCKVAVDASCSKGDIARYNWEWNDGFMSYFFTSPSFVKDWGSCPLPTTLTLTVTSASGASDSVTKSVNVTQQRSASESVRLDLVASVDGTDDGTNARLVVNDTTIVDLGAAGSRRIQVASRAGAQRLAVRPAGPASGGSPPGRLTLDFGSTRGLVPGSLVVIEGDVVSSGPTVVVLRLAGRATVTYSLR